MERSDWLAVIEELGPQFAAGAAERDTHDTFVADHYPPLKERGVISALVPAELGGGGASHSTMAAMLRQLARYDGSTALALSMHQHLVAAQVVNHFQGKPAPILERVARERIVLVSTGARDWLESTGGARAVDGGYRVSARKAFASGAPAGDVAVTSVPFEDPEAGWQVLHFGVPLAAPGVSIEQDWEAHGMRATGSHTIVFDDVFVPESAITLRRPRGEFHGIWNVIVTAAMPLITGVYVGLAEEAARIALPLARRRADDVTVQWAVGEMQSALSVAGALHDRMVALADDLHFVPDVDLSSEVLALKSQAIEEAQHAVEAAIEAAGGPGYYRRTGLERIRRDIRAGDFHPLPRKQQLSFTGRHALGLPPVEVPVYEQRREPAAASR
ncbi:MAG: acyl-CoA dehydrogenase family protein [Dehalococcoidia bacterium]